MDIMDYGRAVLELLNLMLIGVGNCRKTVLLNPLNVLFNTFSKPASGSFAWVRVEEAECILLNDFRWSQ